MSFRREEAQRIVKRILVADRIAAFCAFLWPIFRSGIPVET